MKKIKWDYNSVVGRWSIEKIRNLIDIICDTVEDENPSKIEITINKKYEYLLDLFQEELKLFKINIVNYGDITVTKKICDINIKNLP